MSDQITTAMVNAYNRGITLLAQQKRSKLIDRVHHTSMPGERVAADFIGAVRVRERTTRHQDTQYINTPHSRRWIQHKDYTLADLKDEQDVVNILNDPAGAYAQAFVAAFNRDRDREILDAALATAYTGKLGTGTQAFDANNLIVDGGTGFTLAKTKMAMRLLRAGSAVEEDGEFDLTIAWTSFQEEEFLDTTEVKSVDYNTQRVLVDGTMGEGRFYGFNYIRAEDWTDDLGVTQRIVAKDAADTYRRCVAWKKMGIWFNEPLPVRTRVSELETKDYATQIHSRGSYGAVRTQESMVIEIDAIEA